MDKRERPYHVIAKLDEMKSLEAGRIAGNGQVEFIYGKDFISRITAQTCRQPGLSLVYGDLLDFSGDEIYFSKIGDLTGKTFKEAMFMFEDSCLIGISSNEKIILKPPMDHMIKEDDQIITISEDDDKIILSGNPDHDISDSLKNSMSKNVNREESDSSSENLN